MTYEIYRYIFLGCAGLSVLCLILAVILFFVLKIPKVIGDLTGSTARKAIENIRNQNENTGEKVHKTSAVNRERGKITDRITDTGRVIKVDVDDVGGAMATTKISTTRLKNEARESYENTLRDDGSGETTVLDAAGGAETTVLDSGETTVLDGFGSGETTVLGQDQPAAFMNGTAFTIEYDLTFIHTDEVIA